MGNEVILYIIAYVTINSNKIASNLVLIVLNLFCYEYNNDVIFPTSPTDSLVIYYKVVSSCSVYFHDY